MTSSKEIENLIWLTVYYYIQTGILALYAYDLLLTLPLEIEMVWLRKIRASTGLYIMARYFPFGLVLFQNAATLETPHCDAIYQAMGVIAMSGRAAVVVIVVMRTYALLNCNIKVLLFVGLLGLTTIVVDGFQIPGYQCARIVTHQSTWNWINSLCRMIFEVVVLVLSLYQVLNLYKLDRRIAARKDSITLLTARSGFVYFLSIVIVELLNMIFTIVPTLIDIFSGLSLPISSILITRFLLDIRQLNVYRNELRTDELPTTTWSVAIPGMISIAEHFDIRPDFGGGYELTTSNDS